MTVAELIAELQKLDPALVVAVRDFYPEAPAEAYAVESVRIWEPGVVNVKVESGKPGRRRVTWEARKQPYVEII